MESEACALVESIWRRNGRTDALYNGDPVKDLTCETYCQYYCGQWHLIADYAHGGCIALSTGQDVYELISHIQAGESPQNLVAGLKSRDPVRHTEEVCADAINLAARLLLMLKFGAVKHQANPRRYLNWTTGSLQDFVTQYFCQPPRLSAERVRLPRTFNAWSLYTIGGINIEFTDNLADHLLLVGDDTKLKVFHHASFLEYQRRSSLFPSGFVDETLATLALLFPQSEFHKRTGRRRGGKRAKWLDLLVLKQRPYPIDPRLTLCGNLDTEDRQIEQFDFWKDRLIILKQAYDEATPTTITQWWFDRRNGVQWYTFWVAIIVLIITTFLGVLQCIEGALQVYKSYIP
ncbi:hypothetical protein BX600DRAFT_507251 [Xylariales sp. PMI_506]|nr:hypothetical protein BX600DRAFT_507251 [Xylariales sp. PMI_506]